MNVMITGAAGGLGRALAVACAKKGFHLYLTDISETGLMSIREGILRRYPVSVWARTCDLTCVNAVSELMEDIRTHNIALDMLLNVAGIDFEGGFTQRPTGEVLKIVQLNIEATLNVTHQALKMRRLGGRFHIVFVSSLASLYPMPLKATYAASKRFLLDFAFALEQELKPQGVSVLSLCPGGLATTPRALAGIAAQGFWGGVTTNRLEVIANKTVSLALRGRRMYIPGVVNRLFSLFGKLVPRSLVAKLLYGRWQSAKKSG